MFSLPLAGDWYDNLVRIEKSLKDRSIIPQRSKNIFNANFLPAGIEDDHIPFKRRGVPILHLIAYPFPREWHKAKILYDFGMVFDKCLSVCINTFFMFLGIRCHS